MQSNTWYGTARDSEWVYRRIEQVAGKTLSMREDYPLAIASASVPWCQKPDHERGLDCARVSQKESFDENPTDMLSARARRRRKASGRSGQQPRSPWA